MIGPKLAMIRPFEVVPSLPRELYPLLRIAQNLWWSWHPEAVELFTRIDRGLWRETRHNPVKFLGVCPQERLDEAARDEGFMAALARAEESMDSDMRRTPWLVKQKIDDGKFTVAYFCAEFGLTECLQIYSGGLGCLAGDHLKSASELGLPLVGVGLLYRNGYFQQYLNSDGWQQEYYPELDFHNLPVAPVLRKHGEQVKVSVDLPGREVHIAVWRVEVGRIQLYLLDTNLPENDPNDRGITSQLYGGDMELRIKQEVVLGIGGVRALDAIGVKPDICHMNEGHSAFLALERIRCLIEEHDITFDEARQYAAASHVFTTHTPVPAGIDRFPPEMIQRYFKQYHHSLRLDMEGLLALGRKSVFDKNEFFSMAVLAIRTADQTNGVSKLHGEVARQMWSDIWPGMPEQEVPITHVTNGVHARSWLSSDLIDLLNRYLGGRWQNNPTDQTIWKAVQELPDEELWRVKEDARQKMIIWARRRVRQQMTTLGSNPDHIEHAVNALNPKAFTVGFARRFAAYKRANLLLRDVERLCRILESEDRPIQFLIAGKAHPADGGGKDLIRQIVHFTQQSEQGHKIVFIENYDIEVARYLVQGCDLWLNTPRRGMEASGTSGMKAAINGVLNCSILDGWWDEAYVSRLGWAIGRGESYGNVESQDEIESKALYDLLEEQIIPLFYDRDVYGVPRNWIKRMKDCITHLAPEFNTNRMVQEYCEKLYLPAVRRSRMLRADGLSKSKELAHFKDRLRAAWSHISIDAVDADTTHPLGVNEQLRVKVVAGLAGLTPQDVRIQAYHGPLDNDGQIVEGQITELNIDEELADGKYQFSGSLTASSSGKYGFAVRVLPGGNMVDDIVEPGLIKWDGAAASAQPTPAAAS